MKEKRPWLRPRAISSTRRVLRRAWTERAVWRGVCISPGSVKLVRQERSRKTHIRDRERSIRRDQETRFTPGSCHVRSSRERTARAEPPLVAASRMIRESGNRFSLRQREAFARRSCSNELAERNDDSKKGRPGLVAISRRTIGQAGYTGRTAIVWHEGGRSRRKFFRIRVGVRRPVDVAWLRRVRRSISFIEGGGSVYLPRWHITRRRQMRRCVVRGARRAISGVAVFGSDMNMSRRDIDASRRHVDGLQLARRSLR